MKCVEIQVMKKACYPDLIGKYELPLTDPCNMQIGQVFYSYKGECPIGFCANAWDTLSPFVNDLLAGKGHFYGDWMQDPYSAMLSCNDGFRPVSFLLTLVDNKSL